MTRAQSADAAPALAVLPAFRVSEPAKGEYLVPNKFLTGIDAYRERWPGRLVVMIEPMQTTDDHLDHVRVRPETLDFDLIVASYESDLAAEHLRGVDVALFTLEHRQLPLAEICRSANTAAVFVSELTLQTRLQIVRASCRNPLKRLRRSWWEQRQEKKNRHAVSLAAGVQCNGTPTYNAYRTISPNPLLYFDTRTSAAMAATGDELLNKHEPFARGDRPLHLAFSGRLVAIKGVDHLPRVAEELRKRGLNFRFSVCGAGDLEKPLWQDVQRRGLAGCFDKKGVLNFEKELLPFIKREVDLFVCCHRQGDPSCTYLETMACGVPVIGYRNEALMGLEHISNGAVTTEMENPAALAEAIARLAQHPGNLLSLSQAALTFAREHTFERTFARRVDHLQRLAAERPHSKPVTTAFAAV